MTETLEATRVRDILAIVKPLAAEFYRLTGRPLGITGEIAEYVAAELLKLELAPPRQAGYDAIRHRNGKAERVQIKGRAFAGQKISGQRMGTIKLDADCDIVLLILLESATLEPVKIFEADYADVCKLLEKPSKAHGRGSLSIPEFVRVAREVRIKP